MSVEAVREFLPCATPPAWIEWAQGEQELLLIDHAHCEKKAASTALSLMFRHPERTELVEKMSRLAREELRHFEQVHAIMQRRGIAYRHISPSRYAAGMMELVRGEPTQRLVDNLVVGAFIEARSCERFAALIPVLDEELAGFYERLLRSESRHFTDYLSLAEEAAGGSVADRIAVFAEREAELIEVPDAQFRFHSGPPATLQESSGKVSSR